MARTPHVPWKDAVQTQDGFTKDGQPKTQYYADSEPLQNPAWLKSWYWQDGEKQLPKELLEAPRTGALSRFYRAHMPGFLDQAFAGDGHKAEGSDASQMCWDSFLHTEPNWVSDAICQFLAEQWRRPDNSLQEGFPGAAHMHKTGALHGRIGWTAAALHASGVELTEGSSSIVRTATIAILGALPTAAEGGFCAKHCPHKLRHLTNHNHLAIAGHITSIIGNLSSLHDVYHDMLFVTYKEHFKCDTRGVEPLITVATAMNGCSYAGRGEFRMRLSRPLGAVMRGDASQACLGLVHPHYENKSGSDWLPCQRVEHLQGQEEILSIVVRADAAAALHDGLDLSDNVLLSEAEKAEQSLNNFQRVRGEGLKHHGYDIKYDQIKADGVSRSVVVPLRFRRRKAGDGFEAFVPQPLALLPPPPAAAALPTPPGLLALPAPPVQGGAARSERAARRAARADDGAAPGHGAPAAAAVAGGVAHAAPVSVPVSPAAPPAAADGSRRRSLSPDAREAAVPAASKRQRAGDEDSWVKMERK
jgi:hypothetical protein